MQSVEQTSGEEVRMLPPVDQLVAQIIAANRHRDYCIDIELGAARLDAFSVCAGVLRPELVTSLHLARFLARSRHLYRGRIAIDLGSGSGIQGVVMAISGAERVVLSDISPYAIMNTQLNVKSFGLQDRTVVLEGDLFSRFQEAGDLVVFNHPFFPGQPKDADYIERALRDDGELIHRFFDDAHHFASCVVMPFLHVAGETNDPGIQGPRHGYRVINHHRFQSTLELNPGDVSIYELSWPHS